jgi:hypothetical protein
VCATGEPADNFHLEAGIESMAAANEDSGVIVIYRLVRLTLASHAIGGGRQQDAD